MTNTSLKFICLLAMLIGGVMLNGCTNQSAENQAQHLSQNGENLAVLWTSGDPAVAHKVCFMYTHNAQKQGWFGHVQLIVWGPSSKLLSEDTSLQAAVKTMIADGVAVKACKACADSYGVSDDLAALGIEVKYMGKPLTRMLKSDQWEVLSF